MYLWIVLGTFMVALLSFSLPVREDIDRQNNESKAQTVVTKFKVQHNAFMQYIESRGLRFERDSDGNRLDSYDGTTVPYYSGIGYTKGRMLPSKLFYPKQVQNGQSGFRGGVGVARPFNPEEEKALMERYLPFGFKTDSNIYSKVFCFAEQFGDQTETADFEKLKFNHTTICEKDNKFLFDDYAKEYCCSSSEVDVYVISWQALPPRWVQPDPLFQGSEKLNQPTADMMSVVAKSSGFGYSFGYVTYLKSTKRPKSGHIIESNTADTEKVYVDRDRYIMSGGMYRVLRAQLDDENKPTGRYEQDLGYRPIFDILLNDTDFSSNCAYDTNGERGIKNPCLIAVNKVRNRE